MSGRRWTEAEIERLRALVGTMPVAQIADRLGRMPKVVRQAMYRFRLSQRAAARPAQSAQSALSALQAPTCGPGGCIAVTGMDNHGKMHFCPRPALTGLPYCARCMPVLRGAAAQAGKRP